MTGPLWIIRPLVDRTGFSNARQRQPNPFRVSWNDTLKLLGQELEHLSAERAVVQVDCQEMDLRADGMLKSRAKVDFPGVRLSFDSQQGPLSYATDRFCGRWSNDPPDWQINLRAIALGLEALRKVDRYGIGRSGEQYRGWLAIGFPQSPMTPGDARRLLMDLAGVTVMPVPGTAEWGLIYRRARARAHPDRHGGDRALWDRVEAAANVLGGAA